MTPIAIRFSWRSRLRQGIAAFAAFAGGVVAATAGAPVLPRVVGALVFVIGTYWVLDALVLGSSWRVTGDEMKIPTIVSRRRSIGGGRELVVSASGRWIGVVSIVGERGTRFVNVNPLVSPADLRSWFAVIADDDAGSGGH